MDIAWDESFWFEGGQTALMCAAQAGKLELVQELLDRGADIKAIDEDRWTALIFASKEGHLDIVKALLTKGAEIDHTDVNGWSALMWASYKGHADVAEELLERGASPNVQAHHGVTPIIWAAGRGQTGVVECLLNHGAKANSADKYGTTGLVWAARKGHVGCVKALLHSGANVDLAGMNAWTALIVASRGGFTEVVRLLLDEDPNVNAVDKDGMTSLCCAAKEGHAEVVKLLLEHSPYLNIQDKNDDTVLIHTVKGGHLETVKLLLDKYADVDIQGCDKKTALFWAADKGLVDIAEALLECNANPEIPNKDGETPLLRAVRNRNREIVRVLLDKNAKVSATDKRGDTALHIAIRFRDKKVSELLLRNPKDGRLLYKPNKEGETPYNIDCNHQKGILTQIFGARSFTPGEEAESEMSDLCSSSLADILSEPTLAPPITVGLYARWGSGKSFILKKLQDEMRQFTNHRSKPVFRFSCLVFIVCLLLSAVLGTAVLFIFSDVPGVSIGVFFALFLFLYFLLGVIYLGNRKKWRGMRATSSWLAKQLNYLRLLLAMIYCNPPPLPPQSSKALPIRFIFGEHLHLSNLGGDTPLSEAVASLSTAVERDLGFMASRVYRVTKNKYTEGLAKWKRCCCIPRFLLTLLVLACFITFLVLLFYYFLNYRAVMGASRKPVFIAMIVMGCIVGLALLSNAPWLLLFVYRLVWSPQLHLRRAAGRSQHDLRSESFLRVLKQEADTLSQFVRCVDAFQGSQTRMVVVVDGLDSCEQEQILHLLDSIKALFSSPDSPYITVLAIDPYIIAKAIDQNLHSVFKESNIRGHDYLRNLVHLPFYLEVGIKLKENAETAGPTANHITPSSTKQLRWGLPSIPEIPENDNGRRAVRFTQKIRPEASQQAGTPSPRLDRHLIPAQPAKEDGESQALGRMSSGTTRDVSQLLASDEQFSDLSPRSMSRLLNIVSITGRLLRANNITFQWQRLASWVNVTEKWPYRMSRLAVYCQDNEDAFDDELPLKVVFERIQDEIPASREIEPLLDLDQDSRSFLVYLTKHTPVLTVADVRRFLPCACHLDPYLRKQIKDSLESQDMAGALPNISALSRPQSFGSNFPNQVSSRSSVYSALSDTPSRLSYQMAAINPFSKKIPSPAVSGTPSPGFLTVKDVCDRLLQLEGIDKHSIPRYQARIAEHNVNGHVLLQCDLDELKEVLGMNFGDWQLFRSLVMTMRGQALSCTQSPSMSSSDVLQMDASQGDSTVNLMNGGAAKSNSMAISPHSQNDYLNLSFEELRKSSQHSSQRSSLHNSRLSLGTSVSESSQAIDQSGTSEAEEESSPKYVQRIDHASLLRAMDDKGCDVDREGITQFMGVVSDNEYDERQEQYEMSNVIAHQDVGLTPAEETIPSVSSGLGFRRNHSLKLEDANKPQTNGIHHVDGLISERIVPGKHVEISSTAASGNGRKTKRRRSLSEESGESEPTEDQPLLDENVSDNKESGRHNNEAEQRRSPIKTAKVNLTIPKTENGHEEGKPSRLLYNPEPNIISPDLKAQVVEDVEKMFENLEVELSHRKQQSPPLEVPPPREPTLPKPANVRFPKSPFRGEQQTHDLSLLAGYSSFTPMMRELQSVPETDVMSTTTNSDEVMSTPGSSDQPRYRRPLVRQSQSSDLLTRDHTPPPPTSVEEKPIMRSISQPNRFTDAGLELAQQSSQQRTLDQSFDEFIMLSLEEQRKKRTVSDRDELEKPPKNTGRGAANPFWRQSAPSLGSNCENRDVFTVNIGDPGPSSSDQKRAVLKGSMNL
ncbi:kinase D-interacting substrate of 220 kDa-like isoform X2 [Acanthaster planci]|uniref:Kinase D-interacting substrate of 220 kDa-like isoform X2 n=1 Tax=Acanthaster planci TaxID=133434 RepID=A0A8B7ZZH4_ACAPL|nr:kinase D-interacting substrate of 220 kDa-like isoform X2 [Acanthaster planci]